MQEENMENQETQSPLTEEPQETHADSEKRRIRPVIEEVVSGDSADETREEEETVSNEVSTTDEVAPQPEMAGTPPANEEPKKDLKVFVIVSLVTALVVAALAGGIYVYVTGTKNSEDQSLATPTPTLMPEATLEPTPEASATPTPKPSSYKIEILNGSGKIGEANAAKALIEKEGFKVATTGNAATFDFEDTVIQVKSSVPVSVVDTLKEALSSKYSVVIGNKLPSTSTYDVIITIGSK